MTVFKGEYYCVVVCPECRTELKPDRDLPGSGPVHYRCLPCGYVSLDVAHAVNELHADAVLARLRREAMEAAAAEEAKQAANATEHTTPDFREQPSKRGKRPTEDRPGGNERPAGTAESGV